MDRMSTLTIGDLVKANDHVFEGEVKWRLRRDEWADLMEPELIDRTHEVLAGIIGSLQAQLIEHAEDGEPEWKRRAKTLLALVNRRKSEVNRAIKDLNRTEAADADEWRRFAAKLAAGLEAAGARTVLERIEIPGGDCNAIQWLEARRARAAAKAVAA